MDFGGDGHMSYARGVANLVLDNPDADGRIEKLGVGRDWPAYEVREHARLAGDEEEFPVWDYSGGVEYIPELRAMGPAGDWSLTDHEIVEAGSAYSATKYWYVGSGSWQESSSAGQYGGAKWLQMYDGSAGATGTITALNEQQVSAVLFLAWVFPRHPDEAGSSGWYAEIDWGNVAYRFVLPRRARSTGQYSAQNADSKEPQLRLFGKLGTTWNLLSEHRIDTPEPENGVYLDGLRLERYGSGNLIVTYNGSDKRWLIHGTWTGEDDDGNEKRVTFAWPRPVATADVTIGVVGQPAAFNVAPLEYPESISITPLRFWAVASGISTTPHYYMVRSEPGDTDVSGAVNRPTLWDTTWTRPQLTFTTENTAERALAFTVQEYRHPDLTDGNSSPTSSQGNDNLKLMGAAGTIREHGRRSTCTCQVEAEPGSSLEDVNENQKLRLEVSTDDGSSYDTQFIGYTRTPDLRKEAGQLGWTALTIEADDPIEARLSRKYMVGHCSYEGWDIGEAFRYILRRAGVHHAQIRVNTDVAGNLPLAEAKGERLFQFRPDTPVVEALDLLAEVRDLEWGWRHAFCVTGHWGYYYLRPRRAFDADKDEIEFTIDEDTATSEDVILRVEHRRDMDEYVNAMTVLAGRGVERTARTLIDWASITDSSDDRYIGDDRWAVEDYPDADDAQQVAERLWHRRREARRMLYVELNDHPELMPGEYVKVQVADIDVPTDSVFRIREKRWRIEGDAYWQQLECSIVREGS